MKRASSLATTTTTPPLLAEEWTLRTAPRVAWDATLRIEPRRPPATITRAAAWAQKNPPLRLTSRTKSQVGHDHGPPAGRADLLHRQLGRRAIVEVVDPDVGAGAGQRDRDAPPDSLLGTRDEGDLALEPCHASSPAMMPVRNTPSKVPAPPIETTGAPSSAIRSRLRRSAPIRVPIDPAT